LGGHFSPLWNRVESKLLTSISDISESHDGKTFNPNKAQSALSIHCVAIVPKLQDLVLFTLAPFVRGRRTVCYCEIACSEAFTISKNNYNISVTVIRPTGAER